MRDFCFEKKLCQNEVDGPEDDGNQTKGFIMCYRAFIAYNQSPVVSHPAKAACDFPALTITGPRFDRAPPYWLAPLTAFNGRDGRLDAPSAQSLAQGMAGVGFICSQLLRAATFLWHMYARQRGLRQLALVGWALATYRPIGKPWPSATTITFEPLPTLVLPTPDPPFSPARNCRPERPGSIQSCPGHPVGSGASARGAPTCHPPTPAVGAANTSSASRTRVAYPPRSARFQDIQNAMECSAVIGAGTSRSCSPFWNQGRNHCPLLVG
jgi:hypothetical protein